MDDYISKPINKRALFNVINKWIDTRPVILVTDDSKENFYLIDKYLNKENSYRIVSAHNGQEAIDIYKSRTISLILMDMEMPVMDGYNATKVIRKLQNGSEVPIIAMTAHSGIIEINKCLKAGCSEYISKPIRKQNLIDTIKQNLKKRKNITMDIPSIKELKNIEKNAEYIDNENKDSVVYIDSDIEDIVPGFLENRKKDVEKIKKLLLDENFIEIQRIGHSIKGSGGGYGFDRISEIGKEIEEAAKNRNKDDIESVNNSLAQYLSVVKVVMKEE